MYRPSLAADLEHRLSGPTVTYFTPFFFVSVGLLLPETLPGGRLWGFTGILVGVAVLTKLLGCGAGAWLGGIRGRDALLIGAAMVPRGEVGLIVAAMGRDVGLLDAGTYAAMAVVAVATTLLAPPLIEWAGKRNSGVS